MVDQLDSNTRSPNPDVEIDDPLAELARIIGYERPAEVEHVADEAPESNEFDLEAELMRELDVPLAPSIDDLDRIEAEEALDELLADADFDHEPEQENDARAVAEDTQVESAGADVPELDDTDVILAEGRSSGALLKAIENEFPFDPETDQNSDETLDDAEELTFGWDADELASESGVSEAEPEIEDEQQDVEPVQNDAEHATITDAGAARTNVEAGKPDDDVLADMVRFDLPTRMPESTNAATAPTSSQETASNDVGSVGQSSRSEFDNDIELDGSDLADERAEAPAAARVVKPNAGSDDATLDFEEYLSTELDVFEHEVAMGTESPQIEEDEQTHAADDDTDPDFNVEIALNALNDSTLDEEAAVFDDAAEELLAGMKNEADFARGVAVSGAPSREAADEWSLDSIEETAADELDDELGDMFGLPERAVERVAAKPEETDDFELDLDLALADSFGEADDDWAELATDSADAEVVDEPDEWQSDRQVPEQPAQRDEMAEAFLGLVPTGFGEDSKPEPASEPVADDSLPEDFANEPQQSDWLAGFEPSERTAQPTGPQSGAREYYFDAELISEADETVEVVADIDVPELVHDDPQPLDPDYDTEIEREFAGMIERQEPNSDEASTAGIATGSGAAEAWSRSATASRGYEVSDDYIALERELGVDADHAGRSNVVANSDSGDFSIESDVHHESENGSRGPVLAIAVLALAVLAGVGAFGWSMLSGDETTADGGPRIIRADKDPVKVLPENPGGVTVPNQDKAVYDRVAGGSGASTGQPALVNSAEEPMDVVQRTLDPEILPLEGREAATGKSEDRLAASGDTAEAEANVAAPVVSPRKVRTMIVKPDGSIVAREEPEVSTTVEPEQTVASAASQIEAPTESAPASSTAEEPTDAETLPATDQDTGAAAPSTEGTLAPVRVVKVQPIRPVTNAPVPLGRPADQPVNVVGTVTQGGNVAAAPAVPAAPATAAAPAQPVAVAAAPVAAAPVANPGGYYVQIASQPSAEGAQSSWKTLSNRYSSVLGGLGVDIQRADIPGKGVFHRVRIPAGSRDQANALCSRYKAAGGSCFVSR